MKKNNLSKTVLAVAIASTISSFAFANDVQMNVNVNKKAMKQEPVRYIVKFKTHSINALNKAANEKGISIAQARLAANTSVLARHGAAMKLNLNSINAAAAVLNRAQIKTLRNDPNVEYIEVDPKRYLIDTVSRSFESANAVDPMAEATPYGIGLVQANQVSDANTGNRSVCITDTGYDGDHEDLVSYTSAQITGDDNDGNGNDTGNWYDPGHSHGTHVAGTIMAVGNNGKGVTSVNPSALMKLHNVKLFNDAGSWAYGSDLVRTVEQCQAAGANIISMSIGGSQSSNAEESAFINAANAGLLHIAAAGNSGNSSLSYPASYDSVMSVGALNSSKQIANFSQYNAQVEIAAPGVSVNSTIINNGYASWDGTSMATPHVAAVAALVWSHYSHCSGNQIRTALGVTAQDLGSTGRDNYYGYGLVQAKDMYDALADGCDVTTTPPPPPPLPGVLENGVAHNNLSGAQGEEATWTFAVPAGATDVSVTMSGGSGDADLYTRFGAAPTTSTYDCRPYRSGNNETCTGTADDGTYHVMLRGYNAYNGVSLVGTYTDPAGNGTDSYSNATNVNINDNATVSSSINVDGTGDSGTITVDVDIKHTYVSDLTLTLYSPSGSSTILRQNTGGSADNIQQSYTVNASGQDRNGTWRLEVNDNATYDTGYIDNWIITF